MILLVRFIVYMVVSIKEKMSMKFSLFNYIKPFQVDIFKSNQHILQNNNLLYKQITIKD